MSADPRWTEETENLLIESAQRHWIVFWPCSPGGEHVSASCKCGWKSEVFHVSDADPSLIHCVQATLAVMADAGLLVTPLRTGKAEKDWVEKERSYLDAASRPRGRDD